MHRIIRLETPRLMLRPLTRGDFEEFYQLLILDPVVMAFYHGYKVSLSDRERRAKAQRDFFDHFAEGAGRFGYISWAVCAGAGVAAAKGALLGWCGVVTPALQDARLGPELAYMLGQRWHGQGLVTEAARRVLLDAFPRYGLRCLHAVMDTPNVASRRVAEKLGFECRGVVTVYGSDDMVLYLLEEAGVARLRDGAGAPSI